MMSEEESFKVTDRRSRATAASDASPAGAEQADQQDVPAPSFGLGRSDLGGLFMMFASSALVSLGVAPDPRTNASGRDLAQAQAAIDVLVMLREKTSGNRTEHESQLLEGLLYDLQMRFVTAVREARTRPEPSRPGT